MQPPALRPWSAIPAERAWFVWILAGIWRSAARYRGPALLATLARAGVCLGIVRMAGEALLLALIVAPWRIP